MLPSSAEEYLRMVREQAESTPKVVIAKDAQQYLTVKNTSQKYRTDWKSCIPAPEGCAPSEGWKDLFLTEFALSRKTFLKKVAQSSRTKGATSKDRSNTGFEAEESSSQNQSQNQRQSQQILPLLFDENGWRLLLYGSQGHDQNRSKPAAAEKYQGEEGTSSTIPLATGATIPHEGTAPRPQLLIRLDQGCILHLLKYHLKWLDTRDISEQESQWLYALFLKLDPLVESYDVAVLRNLAKKCALIRSHLNAESGYKLASVNIVITIVSRLFGQNDLE